MGPRNYAFYESTTTLWFNLAIDLRDNKRRSFYFLRLFGKKDDISGK